VVNSAPTRQPHIHDSVQLTFSDLLKDMLRPDFLVGQSKQTQSNRLDRLGLERMTPTEEEYPNGKEMTLTEDGRLFKLYVKKGTEESRKTQSSVLSSPRVENTTIYYKIEEGPVQNSHGLQRKPATRKSTQAPVRSPTQASWWTDG
jgi:hypothetical protein